MFKDISFFMHITQADNSNNGSHFTFSGLSLKKVFIKCYAANTEVSKSSLIKPKTWVEITGSFDLNTGFIYAKSIKAAPKGLAFKYKVNFIKGFIKGLL